MPPRGAPHGIVTFNDPDGVPERGQNAHDRVVLQKPRRADDPGSMPNDGIARIITE